MKLETINNKSLDFKIQYTQYNAMLSLTVADFGFCDYITIWKR